MYFNKEFDTYDFTLFLTNDFISWNKWLTYSWKIAAVLLFMVDSTKGELNVSLSIINQLASL